MVEPKFFAHIGGRKIEVKRMICRLCGRSPDQGEKPFEDSFIGVTCHDCHRGRLRRLMREFPRSSPKETQKAVLDHLKEFE